VIIVIIVAVISYWWFVIQSEPDATEAPVPEESAPAEESAPPEVAVQSTPASDDPVVLAVALRDAEPVTQTLAEGEMSLLMSFSGDCWAEISDATGRRLFFAMGRAGQSVDLTGTAPLAVLLGNTENVSLRVNGNDYPISPSSLSGRTARLTIMNP
jgi:cytoskeleton protein RodZ